MPYNRTMSDETGRYDQYSLRCPMLGHEVAFSYCRAPAPDLPCRRIFDCWWQRFDVVSFVLKEYGEDTVGRMIIPPQGKMKTLVDLIEKARREST